MMEAKETTILIARFRTAYAAGLRTPEEARKSGVADVVRRNQFLLKAWQCLVGLYGREAPIARTYHQAFINHRSITEEHYRTLVIDFGRILSYLECFSGQEDANSKSRPSLPPAGKNVFIIHGHDELNTLRLQNLLQDHFGLAPVRMMGRPGMSRALLEKFEACASTCALAFALITPDDEILNQGDPYRQARPNVIFEAGWFVGRLGIARVCLLVKGETTVQSDIDGISRIHFRDNVEEKVIEIQGELMAVGLCKA